MLVVTVALVLILLLAIYRAPIMTVLPLIVVGAAYFVVSGIVYLLADGHLIKIDTEGTLLLLVLIFGAGTDYSLLLVHRYREALGAEPGARRIASGDAGERARDRRLGIDRDRRDARSDARQPRVDALARPGARDRDRGDADRVVHADARAAVGVRRAGVLAAATAAIGRAITSSGRASLISSVVVPGGSRR